MGEMGYLVIALITTQFRFSCAMSQIGSLFCRFKIIKRIVNSVCSGFLIMNQIVNDHQNQCCVAFCR